MVDNPKITPEGVEVKKEGVGSPEAGSPALRALEDMIPGPTKPFGAPMDFTRPLRTKHSKTRVRVLAIVYRFPKPVVVQLLTPGVLGNDPMCYTLQGRHSDGPSDVLDLEYVPEEGRDA